MPFENWEEDHKLKPKAIIAILLIASIAIAGTAFAVYKITSPPSAPIIVTTPSTLNAPTLNATTATVGDTVQITTTLSDGAEGLQVFFYKNGTVGAIGSAYTNSQGQVIFNYGLGEVGTYVFTAECVHP